MQRTSQRLKNYRRLGYRVIVASTPRQQLEWQAYRPRMQTPAVLGIATDVDAAVSAANRWIATDCRQCRVA